MKITSLISTFLFSMSMLIGTEALAINIGGFLQDMALGNQTNEAPKETIKSSILKDVAQKMGNNNSNNAQDIGTKGIETTQEWNEVYQLAYNATQEVNKKLLEQQNFNYCAQNFAANFKQETKTFDYTFNSKLIRTASMPPETLNISTFRELRRFHEKSKFGGNIKPLSIPNPQAIGLFIRANKNEMDNVSENSSAMMLPVELADAVNKQYASLGRNGTKDAKNLYVATLRDISNAGYLIIKHPELKIAFEPYFISAVQVYTRNKLMCLYD